jgi:hypothetical protein
VAKVQYSRQEIVGILRRTGYTELADEAARVLPDHPIDYDQLVAFAVEHGVTREDLVNAMGGSP